MFKLVERLEDGQTQITYHKSQSNNKKESFIVQPISLL